MLAFAPSVGGAEEMGDEQQAGWIAAAIALLVALVGWGREFFRKKQDITQDFAGKMLQRIEALEARENTQKEREDTLRLRIDAVEAEAVTCQQKYIRLEAEHKALKAQYEALGHKLAKVIEENLKLRKQNIALHKELQELYKQIGAWHDSHDLPGPDKKSR